MQTLSGWVKLNVQRRLTRLLFTGACFGAAYLLYTSYARYAEQYERLERVRDSITLGVQQSNRPLIESALISVLDGKTIVGVALCSGAETAVAYPPESGAYCAGAKRTFGRWVVKKDLIGLQNFHFVAVFSILFLVSPLVFLLLIALLLFYIVVITLAKVQKLFQREILFPLQEGMSGEAALPVLELEDLRRKNLERIDLIKEQASADAVFQLSAQVAHDIRSPLAALGAAAHGLEMPPEQRKLMEGAVSRMQGIADDLLRRYRAPSGANAASKPAVHALGGLIGQVLAEKRLQYSENAGVAIEFINTADGLEALVDPIELQRLLSNLVNNSVEAFTGRGAVTVGLSAMNGKVIIEVKDNGKGIPPEILAKLGQKGGTHGKTGGTGLGLYHARTAVEGWGGNLKISSEPGKGTTVAIELPRLKAEKPAGTVVLLDDDLLVQLNWKMAAKAAGAGLKSCKTPQELAAALKNMPLDSPLYIDSDLADKVKGEDIAKELHGSGFTDITMATGYEPGRFAHLPWLKVSGKEPPWAQ